jgi:hypothetical protein
VPEAEHAGAPAGDDGDADEHADEERDEDGGGTPGSVSPAARRGRAGRWVLATVLVALLVGVLVGVPIVARGGAGVLGFGHVIPDVVPGRSAMSLFDPAALAAALAKLPGGDIMFLGVHPDSVMAEVVTVDGQLRDVTVWRDGRVEYGTPDTFHPAEFGDPLPVDPAAPDRIIAAALGDSGRAVADVYYLALISQPGIPTRWDLYFYDNTRYTAAPDGSGVTATGTGDQPLPAPWVAPATERAAPPPPVEGYVSPHQVSLWYAVQASTGKNPMFSVALTFTNGGADAASFADLFEARAYQNGTELAPVVLTMDSGARFTFGPVEPGNTVNVLVAFTLVDESEVTIVLHDRADLGGPAVLTTSAQPHP